VHATETEITVTVSVSRPAVGWPARSFIRTEYLQNIYILVYGMGLKTAHLKHTFKPCGRDGGPLAWLALSKHIRIPHTNHSTCLRALIISRFTQ
jgi:hypothetical protein